MEPSNRQPSLQLETKYHEFRQRVSSQPPSSHKSQPSHNFAADEDLDMDAQLENVSPERGGSSLQVSLGGNSIQPAQTTSWKTVQIRESTPPTLAYRNPRLDDASESQNTKKRKAADYSITSPPSLPNNSIPPISRTTSKRLPTLGIDMVGQMWTWFHMQEAILLQKNKKELKEKRTDEEFAATGTPMNEIQTIRSVRRAFPRTTQSLYPTERPDAVPGQHLQFTQVPMYEKMSQVTGLTKGFHVTIRFDGDYKTLSRQEVKIACLARLKHMNIPLDSTYINPIDIGIYMVTRNWAEFVKTHL